MKILPGWPLGPLSFCIIKKVFFPLEVKSCSLLVSVMLDLYIFLSKNYTVAMYIQSVVQFNLHLSLFFIQTHIGSILVAVNPYKKIANIYDDDVIKSYNNKYLGDMPPHIYAIANEAYYAMWRKGGNQCVLIRYNNFSLLLEQNLLIL